MLIVVAVGRIKDGGYYVGNAEVENVLVQQLALAPVCGIEKGSGGGHYLELCWTERRIGSTNSQDIDYAAGGECLDAFILVAEEMVGGQFLCDLGQRLGVCFILIQLGELF